MWVNRKLNLSLVLIGVLSRVLGMSNFSGLPGSRGNPEVGNGS
jgi:hypothetical protein